MKIDSLEVQGSDFANAELTPKFSRYHFDRLGKEDQDMLKQVEFYCYDQQGCRML